ncbi:hypothetical protein E4U57_003675 [Claviceps arundinis]|uniref:DUF8040 domain-containing protein n=1 Tax=Claviceps arundinis TaxID=1623583 RepID=A0A9P7ST90_9HYPO|nr:hypothetical protein E4U57_003675 [Claviceps arundinis]KAG5974298.1 hypothetical protein E4U56_004809 [Claviceps arundinis]
MPKLRLLVLCTILDWAVHTDDLDNTDELADTLEDVLLTWALLQKKKAEREQQAIDENEASRDSDGLGGGACRPHVDRADAVMRRLLAAPDDHFKVICRMRKDVFNKLVYWTRTNTTIRNTRYRVELKLMVYLYLLTSGKSQRNAAAFFHISQASIHRIARECNLAMPSITTPAQLVQLMGHT